MTTTETPQALALRLIILAANRTEPWELIMSPADGGLFVATPGDIVCVPDPNHEQIDEGDCRNFAFIAVANPNNVRILARTVLNLTRERKCHICGEPTDMACSDCRIDLATTVYVCGKSECRDKHEQRCGAVARRKLDEATQIIKDNIAALTEAAAHVVKQQAARVAAEDMIKQIGIMFGASMDCGADEFMNNLADDANRITAAKIAVAEMREACAKTAEEYWNLPVQGGPDWNVVSADCAEKIRAVAADIRALPAPDTTRWTKLMMALRAKDPTLVEQMAEAIAMAATSHFGDDTPYALQEDRVKMVRRIEARAVIDVINSYDMVPVNVTVTQGPMKTLDQIKKGDH